MNICMHVYLLEDFIDLSIYTHIYTYIHSYMNEMITSVDEGVNKQSNEYHIDMSIHEKTNRYTLNDFLINIYSLVM